MYKMTTTIMIRIIIIELKSLKRPISFYPCVFLVNNSRVQINKRNKEKNRKYSGKESYKKCTVKLVFFL